VVVVLVCSPVTAAGTFVTVVFAVVAGSLVNDRGLFGYGITQRAGASFASDDHCLGAWNVFSECAVCCGYGRSGLCKSLTRPEAADGEQSCAKCCHFHIHNIGFVAETSRGLAFGALAEKF